MSSALAGFNLDPQYVVGRVPGLLQIEEDDLARFELGDAHRDEITLVATAASFRAWKITAENIEHLAATHGLEIKQHGPYGMLWLPETCLEGEPGNILVETPAGMTIVFRDIDLGYLVTEEAAE